MPEKDPAERIRVRDKDTGYHLTIARSALPHGHYQELKQDAVDHLGDDLPPDHNPSDGQPAATSKE